MKNTVIVNIYNFIRMSHVEPSRFIPDDFETIRNQIITLKQYGFPGTYALKYDALMDARYQQLLREYLDDSDELGAWWEITESLCDRAGVRFRGGKWSEEYDDRVDSAYSIGYEPEERRKLVDAYMADFYRVFEKYPRSIGSWVLDSVTLAYARERYGVEAAGICRDQMGVDGFTLWGGYPNGIYYPSRSNGYIPAQSTENQLDIPVFRLLGPDPIYNFEAEVRDGLQGVYTLEPSWLVGRDPKWIGWFFDCLTEENALGVGYAQVGQENNFLWENIRPGFAPQLDKLKELQAAGKVRVETMADSARWFRQKYRVTPPMTFQASSDWNEENGLKAQWYACANYRVGFMWEKGRLRIRDCFLYDENYPSRYLNSPMKGTKSTFDALPLMFPQMWQNGERPFIRLADAQGREPEGNVRFFAVDDLTVCAELYQGEDILARFTMNPEGISLRGSYGLAFDTLPVYEGHNEREINLCHEGYDYSFRLRKGTILRAEKDGALIQPEQNEIDLRFGEIGDILHWENQGISESFPTASPVPKLEIPPFSPEFLPGDSVFEWGKAAQVGISCRDLGQIRYTLDGSKPSMDSPLYEGPLTFESDTVLHAVLFAPDGRCSEISRAEYRFGLKDMTITSPTVLDSRPVFSGNGVGDLLDTRRGSLDYLDGCWRGTLQDMDVSCTLPQKRRIKSVSMGFLSHHRSGIVFPEAVELYIDGVLDQRIQLPCVPGKREIEKQDIVFLIGREVGAFRVVARRYERMPQWCCYRGTANVFTMADSLMVVPEE